MNRIRRWLSGRHGPFGNSLAATASPSESNLTDALFDPAWPELIENPYPALHRLRSEDPVHWSDRMNSWLVTRYADVVRVLRDERYSSDRDPWVTSSPLMAVEGCLGAFGRVKTMISVDPPDHSRLRQVSTRMFSPSTAEAMRPRFIEVADELLDPVQRVGSMDFMRDFAIPLAVAGVTELLGIPRHERAAFLRWSEAFGAVLDLIDPAEGPRASLASDEMAAYLLPRIHERRRRRMEDLLGDLVELSADGQSLSDDEVLATCTLMLSALRSSAYVLGNGFHALLQIPEQWHRLQADLSLTESAVDELLRYDGPVFSLVRFATEDMQLGDRDIRRGQIVQVLLQAANRDPAQFPDPDRLDLGRRPNHHLAFGYGTHICLGKWIARVQAQVAMRALVSRYPNLHLAAPAEWRGALLLRRLKSMPVSV